jgi:putative pyruvate formate lyase activating enzyme
MKSGTTIILSDGDVRVIDPDISMLPYLKKLEPDFRISSDPPGAGFVPGFQRQRGLYIGGLAAAELVEMQTAMLWAIHNAAMDGRIPLLDTGEVSLLDINVEVGRRMLLECVLCGWRCSANRTEGSGRCGARAEALYNGLFLHIGEEPPINSAWNLKLVYCPLNCAFCQAPENKAAGEEAKRVTPELWKVISGDDRGRSLEFVGGEPMVSAPGILQFLSLAPDHFKLPIVMNCSAFLSSEAVDLMRGVVDVWMPDFNFGNNECARRLCGAEMYWETATEAVSRMCGQNAKVIVRILCLPGDHHLVCCHSKTMRWLSGYRHRLYVSLMDQYLPLHRAFEHKDINRPPSEGEIQAFKAEAGRFGLRDVNEMAQGAFWV